jgi:hypothetical protein
MIEVPVSAHERNVYAGRIWPALASAGRGKTLAQVTAPLPMPPARPMHAEDALDRYGRPDDNEPEK